MRDRTRVADSSRFVVDARCSLKPAEKNEEEEVDEGSPNALDEIGDLANAMQMRQDEHGFPSSSSGRGGSLRGRDENTAIPVTRV
jgi:hypothetical protein